MSKVSNILTSFPWSVRVQTMKNCCPFVFNNNIDSCGCQLTSISVDPVSRKAVRARTCGLFTVTSGHLGFLCTEGEGVCAYSGGGRARKKFSRLLSNRLPPRKYIWYLFHPKWPPVTQSAGARFLSRFWRLRKCMLIWVPLPVPTWTPYSALYL